VARKIIAAKSHIAALARKGTLAPRASGRA